jgi:hypothetical protein
LHKTEHRLPLTDHRRLHINWWLQFNRPLLPNRWSALQPTGIFLSALIIISLLALVILPIFRQAKAQAPDARVLAHWQYPAAVGPTLELEEYWQLVEDTRDQAVWAKNHAANEIRPSFLQAANLWESVAAVNLPTFTTVSIDTSAIVTELRKDPPEPERLESLLNAMLDQRQNWPGGPFGTADTQKLKEILSKPEYQWSEEAPPSPLEEWISKQFERFVNWLFGTLEGNISSTGLRIWQLVLIGLGALALAFVLGYVGRHLRKAVTAEAELAANDRIEENLSAGAALNKAQAMANSGDYRMAVRYLYLAALLQLEERGLLRYDRSRTNREYLREINRSGMAQFPGLSDNFAEVVEVFDRVWYGYQPLDQTGYENFSERVARLAVLQAKLKGQG